MNEDQRILQLIRQEARDIANQVYNEKGSQYGVPSTPYHVHNGTDAPAISQADIIPGEHAGGTITMAQSSKVYELGLTFNPTRVDFSGFILRRRTGTIDIRSHVIGLAYLGPSFYFQPDTSTTVVSGGPMQNIIQSCSAFTVDSSVSPPFARTYVSAFNLVALEHPLGSLVARARVVGYKPGKLLVQTFFESSEWFITGNFMVS